MPGGVAQHAYLVWAASKRVISSTPDAMNHASPLILDHPHTAFHGRRAQLALRMRVHAIFFGASRTRGAHVDSKSKALVAHVPTLTAAEANGLFRPVVFFGIAVKVACLYVNNKVWRICKPRLHFLPRQYKCSRLQRCGVGDGAEIRRKLGWLAKQINF